MDCHTDVAMRPSMLSTPTVCHLPPKYWPKHRLMLNGKPIFIKGKEVLACIMNT